MNPQKIFAMISLMLFVGLLAGCSSPTLTAPPDITIDQSQPTVAPTQPQASVPAGGAANPGSADPFAYCSMVGTIDAPDAGYTGPKTPDMVVRGVMKATGAAADAPVEVFARSTFWRCMNGKVYACTVGANLPCQEKADTNKTPTAAMNDYCKANSKSDFIPAVVTGRATVYEWKCGNGKPEVAKEVFKADARGFISDFWYEIAPTTSVQPTVPPAPAAKRITFAPGGISATVQGTTRPVDVDHWVIAAQAGQTMSVSLIVPPGGRAALVIYGVDGTVLISDHASAMQWNGPLPKTQDYFIDVKPETGALSYTLQVIIPPR